MSYSIVYKYLCTQTTIFFYFANLVGVCLQYLPTYILKWRQALNRKGYYIYNGGLWAVVISCENPSWLKKKFKNSIVYTCIKCIPQTIKIKNKQLNTYGILYTKIF